MQRLVGTKYGHDHINSLIYIYVCVCTIYGGTMVSLEKNSNPLNSTVYMENMANVSFFLPINIHQ